MLAGSPATVKPPYGPTALKGAGDSAKTASRARVGPLKFLLEERGATSAEYALIAVMLGLGVCVAAWGLAGAIAGGLNRAGAQIAAIAGPGAEAARPGKPAKPATADPDEPEQE